MCSWDGSWNGNAVFSISRRPTQCNAAESRPRGMRGRWQRLNANCQVFEGGGGGMEGQRSVNIGKHCPNSLTWNPLLPDRNIFSESCADGAWKTKRSKIGVFQQRYLHLLPPSRKKRDKPTTPLSQWAAHLNKSKFSKPTPPLPPVPRLG